MDSINWKEDSIVKMSDVHHDVVDISKVARKANSRNVARFFDVHLNNMGRDGFHSGKASGGLLRTTHRTLQRSFICWCVGALCGIAEQEYSDPRNADALKVAQKISRMYDKGFLNLGPFI